MDGFKKFAKSNFIKIYIKSNPKSGKLNFMTIDEILMLSEFVETLRSLLTEGGYDIGCTCSNANNLSGELRTYLGQWHNEIPVHSLSHNELLLLIQKL